MRYVKRNSKFKITNFRFYKLYSRFVEPWNFENQCLAIYRKASIYHHSN